MNMQTAGARPRRQATVLPDFLSAEAERALSLRWRDTGDAEALGRLIKAHEPMVHAFVRSYSNTGVPVTDLVQQGLLGLVEAARRFDPDLGCRFSTFARHWLRSEILDYLMRNWSLVSFSRSAAQKRLFFRLRRLKARYEAQGLEPHRIEERIAADLEVPVREVRRTGERIAGPDVSLDMPAQANGPARLDLLVWPEPTPEDAVLEKMDGQMRMRWLRKAWRRLDERQRAILRERYLRPDERATTLKDIGERFGITAERVRQIEVAALRKLRRWSGEAGFSDEVEKSEGRTAR